MGKKFRAPVQDPYEVEYKHWESLYRAHLTYDSCGRIHCLKTASDKADELATSYEVFRDDKYRYAMMVVNLYTNHLTKIFVHVNYYLVSDSTDKVWLVYSDLLSKAIKILLPLFNVDSKGLTVYRGQECHYAIPKAGETYRFGRFTSTSLEPSVALSFAHTVACSTFLEIENAIGLPAKIFSAFPREEEIIIDHDALFHVRRNLNDSARHDVVIKDEIYHEIQRILVGDSIANITQTLPDVYIRLMMSNTSFVINGRVTKIADTFLSSFPEKQVGPPGKGRNL